MEVGPFAKEQFEYDEANDQFRCPQGELLSRKGGYGYNGKRVYAYYGAADLSSDLRRGIPKSSLTGILRTLERGEGRYSIRKNGRTNVIELSEWLLSKKERK